MILNQFSFLLTPPGHTHFPQTHAQQKEHVKNNITNAHIRLKIHTSQMQITCIAHPTHAKRISGCTASYSEKFRTRVRSGRIQVDEVSHEGKEWKDD